MSIRYDSIGRLSKADKTPQGFYRVACRFTRAGVLQYNRGSVVNELRPPEEVFDAASVGTALAGLPVTVGHLGQISPANVAAKVGQTVTDAKRDGQYLTAVLQIEDAGAIARIDSGELVELSAGYKVREFAQESGTYNGMRYDSVQRGIVYNHIALLPPGTGRAGSDVRLTLDSVEDIGYATGVGTISLDGATYEVPDAVAAAWDAKCAMLDQYRAAEMAAEAAKQAVQAVVEATVVAVAAAPAITEDSIKERIETLDKVRKILPDTKFEGQSVRQLQELVLKSKGIVCDSKDDAFVAGAFEACLLAPVAPAVATVVVDSKETVVVVKETPAEVRAKAIAAKANAWKVKS